MNKKLATLTTTALLAGLSLAVMPVETASAASGGWKLVGTRVMQGKTFYRYQHSQSGEIMIADRPIEQQDRGWVTIES